ncbi:hypothetical protein HN924_00065 [Candidatus Woesearchaeota archaeon]|jgi:uncharacterized protein|nr:hypothetical protein [Candidatus Woesearchaeota archaeon]MBT7062345.1 hypothetical protein [Candidatus Woesearchaeota archaeon]MBT7403148.1 hypothetical protein [Candidatus Woesearchaeota archaeon]
MYITNETKAKVLAKKIRLCDNLWSSMRGLMLRDELKKGEALLIDLHKNKNASIHMFLVGFPIDVIWLNSEKLVVDTAEDVKPNTITNPSKFARYIIELPKGTLKEKPVSFRDRFSF